MSKFCRYCGKKLKKRDRTCPRCGNILEDNQVFDEGRKSADYSRKILPLLLVFIIGFSAVLGIVFLLRINRTNNYMAFIASDDSSLPEESYEDSGEDGQAKENVITATPTPTQTPTSVHSLTPKPTIDSTSVFATSSAAPYRFLDEELGRESFAIGFRKGEEDLAETVSGAVLALVLDGTYDRISNKYPGIKGSMCLKADDIDQSEIPASGSGESGFTFKQGFDLDYPPYSYQQEDGSVGGFDVELCKAVCEYLGWRYEPVPLVWDAKDEMLNTGKCDCIWSGFTKEGRENEYAWGITYSVNTQCILVPADSEINSFEDLRGKTMGVQENTSAQDMLEEYQKELTDSLSELKLYEYNKTAFEDLKEGKIDALAIDRIAGITMVEMDS